MAKHSSEGKLIPSKTKRATGPDRPTNQWPARDAGGSFTAVRETRVQAVMAAAERSGLLQEKSSRIAGRISPALIRQAKEHSGIETDTDLLEFALANIALDDHFAESFKAARGTVDPALKLGF